jgi:hypothetical protein
MLSTQLKNNSENKIVIPPSSPSSLRPISVSADESSIGNSSIASQGSIKDNKRKLDVLAHPKVVMTAPEVPPFGSSEKNPLSIAQPSLLANSIAPLLHTNKTTPLVLPFVSNDSKFVASTLKQRDEQEVLRAAQAMLYEAFMHVLQQQQQDQHS